MTAARNQSVHPERHRAGDERNTPIARAATLAVLASLAVVAAGLLVQRDGIGEEHADLVPWLWGAVAFLALAVWLWAARFLAPAAVPGTLPVAEGTPLRRHAFRRLLGSSLAALIAGLALLYHDLLSSPGAWLWLAGVIGVAAAFAVREAPWPPQTARTSAAWLWRVLAATAVCTAFGLRIYRLDRLPAIFLQDEGSVADWGLNFLHHTPVWGQHIATAIPLFRNGATAYPLLGSYVHALVMQVAGETVFGLRITSAVCGAITVWLLYGLTRPYVRRWAAVAATLLLAVSHVHLYWSRSGMLQSITTMAGTLVICLTLRGLRSPGYFSFVLGGLCLGAAQYLYEGARFLVPILVLFFAYTAVTDRAFVRQRWSHVAVMAATAFAVFAPIGFWYLQHPGTLLGRSREVLVFSQPGYHQSRYPGLSTAEIVLAQLHRSLLGFAYFGDGSAAFYDMRVPLVDPIVGALVLIGIPGFTLRARRPADVLVALWIWVPVAIACTSTIDPPPMTRLILMLPALFFVVAVVLDRLGQLCERGGLARLTAPLVAAGLGYATLWNYQTFFVDYPRKQPANMWTVAGHLARAAGPASKTYMMSPMHLYFYAPEMRFLARGMVGEDLFAEGIPVRERSYRDGLFLVSPAVPEVLARLRAAYPNGQLDEHRNPHDVLLFTAYRVAAADLTVAAGSDAPWRQYDLRFGMGGTRRGEFERGAGLAVDRQGQVYVADAGNGRIDVFDPQGKPLAAVGRQGSDDTDFRDLGGVAVAPDGSVLGLDRETRWIKRFSRSGAWLGNLGGPTHLSAPAGIAVASDGSVLVADSGQHAIMRFDLTGRLLARTAAHGSGPGQFERPEALAVAADGSVVVSDAGNGRVQRLSPQLAYQTQWPVPLANPGHGPAVAVADADGGAVYVADPPHGEVHRYTAEGRKEWAIGTNADGPSKLMLPVAVATDAAGNVHVLDTARNQVFRFDVSRRLR